ncbi:MBL fold metallo-hydrolase [Sediminimonas sp.]|uniref:MBL fold metallo-hydrolase n=1 Tax=Sediminimonas sp. TaxID=2823379 RepID=UPI0025D44914|nr:MBL fold metallo-hydrolase [Sediminimonas sp.]
MQTEDDFDPPAGVAQTLAPGLRRVLAPNPSPMTWRGTNTYLLGGQGGIAVIDPGPDDTGHLTAIMAALEPGQKITHILVTHAHLDHSPLARTLARETGAPVLAYGDAGAGRSAVMRELAAAGISGGGEGVDARFVPDESLPDGARIVGDGWQVEALWTPGHFGNHLCFCTGDAIFTGDLVMGWASSLVSPPDGDLTDFMASCRRLRARGAGVFHPGHGAPVTRPAERLDWLIAHREARGAAILGALRDGPADATTLARRLYTDTPAALLPAAARNVFAHLIDMEGKSMVRARGPRSADTAYEIFA